MTGRLNSETMLVTFAIFGRVCAIFMITHICACGWYAAGTHRSPGPDWDTWVYASGMHDRELLERYVTALHWSVTQVHGSMEVAPKNSLERTYAVVAIFGALFVFTVLIGNFANLLGTLWSAERYSTRQLWLLRQYLR